MYQEIFTGISRIPYSEEQLSNIKERYQRDINSKRCCERINSMEHLLRILEKRDCLSPENIQVFIDIATSFNQAQLLTLIRNYNQQELVSSPGTPPVIPNNVAAYAAPPPVQPGQLPIYLVIPPVPQDLKQRVYQTIAEHLGKNWQDFARALHVQEGLIDGLSDQLRLQDRIYAILRFHEENCDKRTWKTNLLEALNRARRNDLRQRVEHIFDTHS